MVARSVHIYRAAMTIMPSLIVKCCEEGLRCQSNRTILGQGKLLFFLLGRNIEKRLGAVERSLMDFISAEIVDMDLMISLPVCTGQFDGFNR
jgi:hypothetical protein